MGQNKKMIMTDSCRRIPFWRARKAHSLVTPSAVARVRQSDGMKLFFTLQSVGTLSQVNAGFGPIGMTGRQKPTVALKEMAHLRIAVVRSPPDLT